jgi:hypothetical protein
MLVSSARYFQCSKPGLEVQLLKQQPKIPRTPVLSEAEVSEWQAIKQNGTEKYFLFFIILLYILIILLYNYYSADHLHSKVCHPEGGIGGIVFLNNIF